VPIRITSAPRRANRPTVTTPAIWLIVVSSATGSSIVRPETSRMTLPLSLSYDHRVIDGAAAARFTAYLAGLLSDLRRAML